MAHRHGRREFQPAVRQAALRALSIAVSGAALGTRSNFIIGADRIRRCLLASCCAGNVIARRISQ
jgi:hypothetical protein